MVRAKFRCMSITQRLNDWSVELKPVIAKNKDWPGGSEENAKFWSASPSGDATVVYRGGAEIPFRVGAYYYVDLAETPAEEAQRTWKLWEVSCTESRVTVKLGLPWHQTDLLASADLSIGIENQSAWSPFLGRAGSRWSVTFGPAPAPENGLQTYP